MTDDYNFDRNKVDNISKRKHFKEDAFGDKKTYVDPYSGETLHKNTSAAVNKYGDEKYIKHTSDVDHITPLKKISERYADNPFLTQEDIKTLGNQNANYRLTSSKINRQKGDKTNLQYIKNADIPVKGKVHMLLDQVSSETAIRVNAGKLTAKNIVKSVGENGFGSTVKAAGKALEKHPEVIESGQRAVAFLANSTNQIVAVASGEKTLAEAGADTAKYVGSEVVSNIGDKLIDKALDCLKKTQYAQVVYAAIYVGKNVGQNAILYINGDISGEQFWENVGESGAEMLAQAAGGLVGGILFGTFGAMIGSMIASEVVGAVYRWVQKVRYESKIADEKLSFLSSVADSALDAIRSEQKFLDSIIEQDNELWSDMISSSFDAIENGLNNNDADEFSNGLEMIAEYYGGHIQFHNAEEFDEAFLSDDFSIDL